MKNNGYIKLFRKITEWEWYEDANTFRLFIHLILKANHKTEIWHGVEIKRGEIITSLNRLSTELKLGKQQIRTSINKLKITQEITQLKNKNYTYLSIKNYDSYQENNTDNNIKVTSNQHANQHESNTKQEDKNIRREEINNTSSTPVGSNENIDDLMPPNSPIKYDWQYLALEIIEKLQVPNEKKSSFFKAAKEFPNLCQSALSSVIDFPNPKIRWNMFFKKFNELRKK